MDILNPLYLKAQKLLRTSAEPGSIVYLSVPDSKRDDKFLTIGVPIENLADVIGALTTVETDGVTITGDGTPGNPLVANLPAAPTVTSVTLINSLGDPFDINSIDSSPVLLIPAPPAGKYYDWELKFEFTNGNQQYSFDRSMYLTDGVNNFNYIHHSAINGATKRIWYVKEPSSDWYNAASQRVEIIGVVPDAAIYITAVAGFSSPSGNGTLKITATYTEKTFGA